MKKFSIIKVLLPLLLILNVASFAEDSIVSERSALSSQLQSLTQDNISFTAAKNGTVKFISIKQGASIQQPFNGIASSDPTEVAINFLTEYKSLFGKQYKAEYSLIKDTITNTRHSVKLQQNFKGIPVFAGQMVVRLNQSLDVTGANGIVASKLDISTKPLIDKETAKQNAIEVAQKSYIADGLNNIAMIASEPTLWIYNPKLQGKKNDSNKLAWRVDVFDSSHMKSNQYIFIDAMTGNSLNRISNIHEAKNRSIHDLANDNTATYPSSLPGPVARTEGQAASLVTDVNNAYDFFGDTYDFYLTTHNRDSIDNAGMVLRATVRFCEVGESCPYANAAWVNDPANNVLQMIFGEGFTVDDITGHEVTHGFTSFTSNLIYEVESGAINESFSDVWGEFVDLSNSAGNDAASVRWDMGEDIGAIRNMKDPTLFGDPDKITSSNYYCGTADHGGVHTNSGVNNKAAYLMVDGDTFNGFTINGIGITKTAKIYYEAQTNILTSGSTYPDLYAAMNAACNTLVGTAGITAANCTEVKKALDAVEMYHSPCTGPLPAPVCPVGQTPNYLVNEGFDGGLNGWTHSAVTGTDAWSLSSTFPHTGTKHIHGADANSTSDSSIRSNLSLNLPANAYLRFTHGGRIETTYDGGVVEYTTNGGTSWQDTATMFTHNGYTGTMSALGTTRPAFNGNYTGIYYSSRINLNSLAGSNVDFRFRIGTDSSLGYAGWDIDDIEVYTCGQPVVPAKATLVSPSGNISDNTPTYTWNAVSSSTWYYLWVSDSSSANKIKKWYSAAQAGCNSGSGTCSVTPTTVLANGVSKFWIQTWNNAGDGPWSSAKNFTVSTLSTPAKATLVSPSGNISDNTPTYTWNAVSNSTWYYLWVDDSSAGTSKFKKWYSAAQAGCSSGAGTCSITPATPLADGAGKWWIQTWNNAGDGPWSNTNNFTVVAGKPPAATLVSPSGNTTDNTPTYVWNAVSSSTWYYLWVSDSTSGQKIKKWYSAAQAGCSSGAGTCSITPVTPLANGAGKFWIQTWNNYGKGPWSSAKNFNVQ